MSSSEEGRAGPDTPNLDLRTVYQTKRARVARVRVRARANGSCVRVLCLMLYMLHFDWICMHAMTFKTINGARFLCFDVLRVHVYGSSHLCIPRS